MEDEEEEETEPVPSRDAIQALTQQIQKEQE